MKLKNVLQEITDLNGISWISPTGKLIKGTYDDHEVELRKALKDKSTPTEDLWANSLEDGWVRIWYSGRGIGGRKRGIFHVEASKKWPNNLAKRVIKQFLAKEEDSIDVVYYDLRNMTTIDKSGRASVRDFLRMI